MKSKYLCILWWHHGQGKVISIQLCWIGHFSSEEGLLFELHGCTLWRWTNNGGMKFQRLSSSEISCFNQTHQNTHTIFSWVAGACTQLGFTPRESSVVWADLNMAWLVAQLGAAGCGGVASRLDNKGDSGWMPAGAFNSQSYTNGMQLREGAPEASHPPLACQWLFSTGLVPMENLHWLADTRKGRAFSLWAAHPLE